MEKSTESERVRGILNIIEQVYTKRTYNKTEQSSELTNLIYELTSKVLSEDYLYNKLIEFEKKYNLNSEEFYNKYISGNLNTSPDFKDWYYFYLLYNRLI